MNAPTRAGTLAEHFDNGRLEALPLTALCPSETHIQALRRKRFKPEALAELADSIRKVGVLQPIVARPLTALRGLAKYEIVAGERRWLAAKDADIGLIDVSVRNLNDEQVLEVQLIENLQREGLHELEEAEGYDELMKLKKIDADAVAAMVGKSRSYVYARIKLLALGQKLRTAFYAGEINSSEALLLARIPNEALQLEAHAELEQAKEHGEVQNFREAQTFIREHFMLQLKAAPFDIKAENLVAGAVPCGACPKRTGNQKELFADVQSADVCTDPACFDAKKKATIAIRKAELEARGEEFVEPSKVKKGDYVELDREQFVGNEYTTARKLLGKTEAAKIEKLMHDPDTDRLVPVVAQKDLDEALKAKGIKPEARHSTNPDRAREQKAKIETVARFRILKAIREASRGRQFDLEDLRLVTTAFWERTSFDLQKRIVDAWNHDAGVEKPKGIEYVHAFHRRLATMEAGDLSVLLLDMALAGSCHVATYSDPNAAELLATAKRLGIVADKIRNDTRVELAEKAKKK